MIYTVQKTIKKEDGTEDVLIFNIDDMILFNKQPKQFRELFNSINQRNIAEFDNTTGYLINSGRILFTVKKNYDEI